MVGLLSVLFAVSIESILDILIYAYTYWAPVVLVPLIAAIYGYRKGVVAFGEAGVGLGFTEQFPFVEQIAFAMREGTVAGLPRADRAVRSAYLGEDA